MPIDENGEENFFTVGSQQAFGVFEKMSENDDVIEFSYEPVEFDREGRWCTF